MIDQRKLSIAWIEKVSGANRNADKILVEKSIRALLLVEGLVKQKLRFVFKGGTAVMLHLNSAKRLSIDVDICIPEKPDNLNTILDQVAKEQGFLRKEEQKRKTEIRIDKAHYKFYYTPLHKTIQEEEFLLLDILFESSHYEKTIQLPVQSAFVPEHGSPLYVEVPCPENLLGDKMTAFAPNTSGIPYFKQGDSMSMEIIKQLYDIGRLFDHVSEMSLITTTFMAFALTELAYRGLNKHSDQDVLEDIYQTALCISMRGADGKGNFDQLQQGIQRLSRFIFSESYHLEKAITDASKAAYLATLIKQDAKMIEKFSPAINMENWSIESPMNTKLNKLKKSNPEAFFYWYQLFLVK